MAADPAPAGRPAVPVRVWATAGVVAFVVAAVSALTTPLMGLPDEPAHAVYAAAVVRGEVPGEDAVRTDPTSGWTRTETAVTVPEAYATLPALPTCFAFDPTVPADCAPVVASRPGPPTPAVTTVGTYAPPWYAVVGWPSLLVPPTTGLLGMRLVAAALFAALVAVAAAAAWRAGGDRWGLVGVAAALPPVAVHLAGGVNPSGTEIAAAVALWAATAAVVSGAGTRADLVRWTVAGVVVALTRGLGPALALAIPVATWLVLARRVRPPPWRRSGALPALLVVGGAVVAGAGWSLWRGTLDAFSGFPAPDLTLAATLRESIALMPERLTEMVGVLGWADVPLPSGVVLGWLAVAGALAAAGWWLGEWRTRWWLLALAAVVLLLPVVADLRSATRIGFVWQGRYTLPVAAGLPVLGGVLLDRGVPPRWRAPRWCRLALAALAVGHLVALLAVLRRFRVGVDGAVVDALGTAGASRGLPGWLLLTVAAGALAVGVLTLCKGPGALRGEVVRSG